MKSVDVCIPVYKPGDELDKLMARLCRQTVKPKKIIIINTEKEYWNDAYCRWPQKEGIEVILEHITKDEYDHGKTRDRMAGYADSELILFMTMDAFPADTRLIENMVKAFDDEKVASCYARQLPKPGCSVLERQTRMFNYPPESQVKSKEDLERLGIKTFFCSNVCAMYKKSVYTELGGFPEKTIFNEDMIFAGKVIDAGYKIAYQAEARVFHSHNYTAGQYFRRSFDMAVSQAQNPQVFKRVSSEKEGMKLVRSVIKKLLRRGKLLQIISFIFCCGAKYAGYFLGKRYDKLPDFVIMACSDNKSFWKNS